MHQTNTLRGEWVAFRRRGRLFALISAVLVTVLVGLLLAFAARATCSKGTVEVPCPTAPTGPDGQGVADRSYFAHRAIGERGGITVRLTGMTGTITYPPPDHDEIVDGLAPWAKVGIMIKDGTTPGSTYAALVMTGGHGVRMQHDYAHDVAGRPGGVSPGAPRWLRLTRDGATITGEESSDGVGWTRVGTAHLPRLPATARVGLFATSPGDLTLRPVLLGGAVAEIRFTQASGVFDHLALDGASGGWTHGAVGELGQTDWEELHRPPGFEREGGTFTVTGSGDVGPVPEERERTPADALAGLVLGLLVVLVVAVRSGAARVSVARAVVVGGAAAVTGLVAAAVTVPLTTAVFRANGNSVPEVPTGTALRIVLGVALLFGLAAVVALGVRALVRRAWVSIAVVVAVVVLPYAVAAVPLLPDEVARWLLRVTPAAGFAAQQSLVEYPQVVAHYAPSTGYFPLAWWAGLAVLGAWAAVAVAVKSPR